VETHITLDAVTKSHPHALSYAQSWSALMKQPAGVRDTVIIALIAAVAFLYFALIRPIFNR
jgi:hypothetical protein